MPQVTQHIEAEPGLELSSPASPTATFWGSRCQGRNSPTVQHRNRRSRVLMTWDGGAGTWKIREKGLAHSSPRPFPNLVCSLANLGGLSAA